MQIKDIIKFGLDEDLGSSGDITSNHTIAADKQIGFAIVNREEIILCGVDIAVEIFDQIQKRDGFWGQLKIDKHFEDGAKLKAGRKIISGFGNARAILAAERLALNLMQHLSGVATTTQKYVQQIASGSKAKILDTRKTIPNLRLLQKYAVKTGGGKNHRMGLYDGVLIKDNHIAAAGSIEKAVAQMRKNLTDKKTLIEVECDNLAQAQEAKEAKADIIMLDNMNLAQIKKAVALIDGGAKIEVSGGIKLENISEVSAAGVDYISVGALTHSACSVDIGLDIAE